MDSNRKVRQVFNNNSQENDEVSDQKSFCDSVKKYI